MLSRRFGGPASRIALCVLIVALVPVAAANRTTERPPIRVNQIGYRPEDVKLALVAAAPAEFAVRDAATQQVVFHGQASAPGPVDRASGDRVATLDFSSVVAPGDYVVTAPGTAPSPPLRISADVYRDLLRAVLRTFTTMRCGAPVRDGSAFARPACHLDDAVEWGRPGVRRSVTGGWHDAGDYGRYVPSAGSALWHLAALHELSLSVPNLSDLRWELDWLVRMQRSDGGVHHKVAPARWTGDRLPHQDRDLQYLFEVSSTATATVAAAAAQASRVFRTSDPAYAARLLAAAEAAWRWLDAHPAVVPPGGFTNPEGVESGPYDDPQDGDDRFWAAAELWRTTGAPRYAQAVRAAFDKWSAFTYPSSWRNVQNHAFLTLLAPQSPLDSETRMRLRSMLVEQTSAVAGSLGGEGYRVALKLDDYYWGSNGVALGRAVLLLAAFRETGHATFREAALDQLHYLLGRNALGKSFITGFGANPVRSPVFQPSQGQPGHPILPGLLVGGPNSQYAGVPAPFPALAYVDDGLRYGVNEPMIAWNAKLAYVLRHVVAGP